MVKSLLILCIVVGYFWDKRYQRNITCKKCGRKFHNQSNWRIKHHIFSKLYQDNVCNQCANEENYFKNR